jgi:WD40 repeat protein
MAFACGSRKIVCVSQDRRISFFDIDSGKIENSFSPSITNYLKTTPYLSSIVTNSTASYCVCSSSDKTIHVIDSNNGNSIYQGFGHGDLITRFI